MNEIAQLIEDFGFGITSYIFLILFFRYNYKEQIKTYQKVKEKQKDMNEDIHEIKKDLLASTEVSRELNLLTRKTIENNNKIIEDNMHTLELLTKEQELSRKNYKVILESLQKDNKNYQKYIFEQNKYKNKNATK